MTLPIKAAAEVAAARDGDVRALNRLMEAWLPVVLRWSMRCTPPGVDPEDVAHDALVQVFTSLPSLRDPSRFAAYVYRIVDRTAAAHARRAWLRKWVPGLTPEASTESNAEESLLIQRIRQALHACPRKHREVLILVEIEGFTVAQTAEILGVPVGTVKSRLRLARPRFAQNARKLGLDAYVNSRAAGR